MATMSSTLAAGRALAGQHGIKAKLAASVAILGCAAALGFGGLRASNSAQSPAMAPAVTSAQASGRARQRFLEQNLNLPSAGTRSPLSVERQRFLEQNLWLPDGTLPAPRLSWATTRFIERNTLPELAPLTPPGPANFPGEDY